MATRLAIESVRWNNAELITPTDLNVVQRLSERRDLMEKFADLYDNGEQVQFIGEALRPYRFNATQMRFHEGTVIYTNATLLTETSPDPERIAHYLDSHEPVTIDAAHATLDRIDIFSMKVEYDAVDTGSDDAETRATKTSGGTLTSQTLDKRRRTKLTITYTAGTPDASPAAPSTPAGEVKFAEIYVTAVTGIVDNAAVTDYRTPAGLSLTPCGLTSSYFSDDLDATLGALPFKVTSVVDGTISFEITPPAKLHGGLNDSMAARRLKRIRVYYRGDETCTVNLLYKTDTSTFQTWNPGAADAVTQLISPDTPFWAYSSNPNNPDDDNFDPVVLRFAPNGTGFTEIRGVVAEWYGI